MLQNLTGWHAIIILVVILLLFGSTKLPALARSVGQSMNIFKTEIREATEPAAPTGADRVTERSPAEPTGHSVAVVDGR
ncbi:Sec-independent protein translocase TatA [Cryobacterium arcticum]|uniref:Sec-independent protein translocase protein TatA n=1 Tax=Cryobacterium arcticum TaxID=670052 RepID=A0A317ZYT0_9MICO|nr:twin-arginine translocase TatA/TatE family subunit [Cryobacterium arcticum]PXA72385.1 Sec-independent protein translocase TatA [Cryobacterium arcticum]